MVTKADLEAEMEGWRDKNNNLFDIAKMKLKNGEYEDAPKVKPSKEKLKGKTVIQLKVIAKKLDVPKYYNLREDDLIVEILKRWK